MLPCCPQTPKTQGLSRGFLHSLLLPASKNTSVDKASAVRVADFTRIPGWEAWRPWRDGNPPTLQGEVHSGLTVLVALPSAVNSRQDCLHGAFVTALSPQPSLLSSFHQPEQNVPRETLKDLV